MHVHVHDSIREQVRKPKALTKSSRKDNSNCLCKIVLIANFDTIVGQSSSNLANSKYSDADENDDEGDKNDDRRIFSSRIWWTPQQRQKYGRGRVSPALI